MGAEGLIPDVVRQNIEAWMKKTGRTQAEVSRLGGLAQGEFSKIVGRKRAANLRNLERIATGLSTDDEPCSVMDLFRTDGPYGDPTLRNVAQLRPWLNQWGREQANRIAKQVEQLVERISPADHRPRLVVHYATADEIQALRDQGIIRGRVAAGIPIFAMEDLPADWLYRAREYVTFIDEQG